MKVLTGQPSATSQKSKSQAPLIFNQHCSRYDRRSPRPSRSARYSRSRSPRYSRSPPPRHRRSRLRSHSYHSPSPRRRSHSWSPPRKNSHSPSPPKKRSYSPSPRQQDYSRSESPDDQRNRREQSYSCSSVDNVPRSRSPYKEEEEERERSHLASG